jgi:hypothetical protein
LLTGRTFHYKQGTSLLDNQISLFESILCYFSPEKVTKLFSLPLPSIFMLPETDFFIFTIQKGQKTVLEEDTITLLIRLQMVYSVV